MNFDKHILDTERFPVSPGVYLMKDSRGSLLYIGKAVNLRSRVRSYFTSAHDDRPHIIPMLKRLDHVEWIATRTETEALILEANLIREHTPPYNVELRDDKHYPYLKVTVQEAFPRLVVTRRIENDGAKYFGPYTDVGAMRRVMNFAKRIFKVRDCSQKLPLARPARPCINYAIGRCSGACAGLVSQEQYRANAMMLISFLKGKRIELLEELERRMREASAAMQYETAAACRDQIALIRDAGKGQKVDLSVGGGDCDLVGIFEGERDVCMAMMHFREGLLTSTRHFLVGRPAWELSSAERDEAVVRYYIDSTLDPPNELLLPEHGGFEPAAIEAWFRSRGQNVSVHVPLRGVKRDVVELAQRNAELYLAQKAPWRARDAVEDLQRVLSLPSLPRTIEAFDISNLGASFAVAGMVQFVDGAPNRSRYRRFRIRDVKGQDDFAMLMEVVTRRLTRLKDEGKPFADLLLIDGGKGQLGAVRKALEEFEQPPMVISLAKQEEILYSPWAESEVKLPSTHPARRLVEQIRDEVHRYAITYHRTVRGGQFRSSALESIPGVGEATARTLLRAFGSVRKLREASAEQIASVKGVSRPVAERIAAILRR